MPSLFKNTTELLQEACECDDCNIEDIYDEDEEEELDNEYDDIDDLEDDIIYTEEMVNIIQVSENSYLGNINVIEYDNLNKLMESKSIDAKEAVDKICEYYNIDIANTYVLIESMESTKESLQEACNKGKGAKKKVAKSIKELKEKGVKLLKKKDKKK